MAGNTIVYVGAEASGLYSKDGGRCPLGSAHRWAGAGHAGAGHCHSSERPRGRSFVERKGEFTGAPMAVTIGSA